MAGTNVSLLENIALFKDLTGQELQDLIDQAGELSYDANSFLFHQDDPAERIFVLKSGRVKLYQLSADGQQVLMHVMTPSMMFAAIAMVEGAAYPVSAEAAEDCKVLYWSQAALLGMIHRYPVLALNALKVLAGHVREFQDRYRELATERVERRVARAVLRLAGQTGVKTDEGVLLNLPLSRQDLAEMTGTTLYTVSRILSSWEEKGLVTAGRERLVIRFPHGLVRIAEDLSVGAAAPQENTSDIPK